MKKLNLEKDQIQGKTMIAHAVQKMMFQINLMSHLVQNLRKLKKKESLQITILVMLNLKADPKTIINRTMMEKEKTT